MPEGPAASGPTGWRYRAFDGMDDMVVPALPAQAAGWGKETAMARQSRAQKETVERVMHEFKHGELETSHGGKVRSPKQAIAIALHEAGASSQESPERNHRSLAHTKERERHAEAGHRGGSGTQGRQDDRTRAELYEEARRRGIPGRSRMGKEELREALRRRRG